MFNISKKSQVALVRAQKSGVSRFQLTPDELHGCFFTLPLVDLVDEEMSLYAKQAELSSQAAKGVSIHANRFLSMSHDLAEIQFCLGLFAIASKYEALFDVDDDTSGEDIYLQLDTNQDKLSDGDRRSFSVATDSIQHAGIKVGKVIVAGVKAINKGTYAAGVAVFKGSRKGLNWLANRIADATEIKGGK